MSHSNNVRTRQIALGRGIFAVSISHSRINGPPDKLTSAWRPILFNLSQREKIKYNKKQVKEEGVKINRINTSRNCSRARIKDIIGQLWTDYWPFVHQTHSWKKNKCHISRQLFSIYFGEKYMKNDFTFFFSLFQVCLLH